MPPTARRGSCPHFRLSISPLILPVLITPERDHPREHAVLEALFANGLERCHVRKPRASADELRAWIAQVPPQARSRLVVHQHHELVDEFGLGGRHWRDTYADLPTGGSGLPQRQTAAGVSGPGACDRPSAFVRGGLARASGGFTSRSCHDLQTLRASLGRFDSVFLSPVFSSISKPGYGPSADLATEQMRGGGTPPTAGAPAGVGVGRSVFRDCTRRRPFRATSAGGSAW